MFLGGYSENTSCPHHIFPIRWEWRPGRKRPEVVNSIDLVLQCFLLTSVALAQFTAGGAKSLWQIYGINRNLWDILGKSMGNSCKMCLDYWVNQCKSWPWANSYCNLCFSLGEKKQHFCATPSAAAGLFPDPSARGQFPGLLPTISVGSGAQNEATSHRSIWRKRISCGCGSQSLIFLNFLDHPRWVRGKHIFCTVSGLEYRW
jgi:hypothetical protein